MTRKSASPILQLIRSAGEDQRVRDLPDHELLGRFSHGRDEAAFQALLRRHGPMVLHVCRSVLDNEDDAEDAFQATFLILARRSSAIRKKASVGSWLHGVAYRTALKARTASWNRQKHEARAPERPAPAADDLSWRELQQVLHAELSRCSECYQVPLVLCYLEGKTQDEAANLLGVSRATVKKRLERGRALLRVRLLRRGLGPAALLALSAWPDAATACLAPALESATIKAVTMGHTAAAGLISARVAALTDGVLKTMWMTRCGIATALLLVGLMAAGIGGFTYQRLAADQAESSKEAAAPAQSRPESEQEKQARFNLEVAEANLKQAEAAVKAARAAYEAAKAVKPPIKNQLPPEVPPVDDVVQVRAQVSGFVEKVHFKAGDTVKKGDSLVVIDARPYKAALEKANADVSQAEERLRVKTASLDRAKELFAPGAIARGDLKKFELDQAEAAAAVQAARAQRAQAQLTLELTWVKAPVDGKISRPFVTPGNLAKAETVVAEIDSRPQGIAISQPLVREVTDSQDYTGRIEAVRSVDIRSRVSGMLAEVSFKAGSTVKRGEPLFKIDAESAKAEVDRAEADVRRSEAKLLAAAKDFERVKALHTRGVASFEEFHKAESGKAEAEAVLQATRASLNAARVKLDFSRITAPIDGKISRPSITPGNVVRADETILATIISVDPVYVSFDVDERTLLRLTRLKREGKIKAEKDVEFPIEMGLADETGYPRRGTLESMDVRVDPKTGTARWRAIFPNTDGLLMPGLFARVRLSTSATYRAILVAEQAVVSDQGQKHLFVATEKNLVELRMVKLGSVHGDLRVVAQGLTAGEWVIVKGMNRVKPGMTIQAEKVSMPTKTELSKPGGSED